MRPRRLPLSWGLAAGLLAALPAAAAPPRPNIIVISLDSLRADHLGCHGYRRNTSPRLDRLAREGLRFAQAIAPASYSLASTVSLFTGQHAPTHGVPGRNGTRLPPTARTWAEILRENGYRTAAFTGSIHNSDLQGLDQGFAAFHNEPEYGRLQDILPRARRWLEDRPSGPFFLFLHAYDAHAPYGLTKEQSRLFEPAGYEGVLNRFGMGHHSGALIAGDSLRAEDGRVYRLGPRDAAHWVAQYDAAIARADRQIGDFLAHLERTGLAKDTLLILLGNHGEALGERGAFMPRRHGDVYEEGIHVPLIIRLPETVARRLAPPARTRGTIERQVQLIDLLPTVLDWLGLEQDPRIEGRSLVPLIAGQAPPDFNRYVFSVGAGGGDFPWRSCVRSEGWKLIRWRDKGGVPVREELYRLDDDPGERRDLLASQPQRARALAEELSRFDAALVPGFWGRFLGALSPVRDAVRSLRRGLWLRRRTPAAYRPNILMIVMESGRPDHFSGSGYPLPTTPNMDELARRGVAFRAAHAQSNWTLPSFAAILTGKHPRALGLFDESRKRSAFPFTDPPLRPRERTLPEVLRAAGYRTAGFFTGRFNSADYGFDRGFDLYRNYGLEIDAKRRPMRSFPDFLPEAFRWMERRDDAPFFVLLNPTETHRPYLPPEPGLRRFAGEYQGELSRAWLSKDLLSGLRRDAQGWSLDGKRLRQEDIDYVRARYDASLARADGFIGEILERLERSQLLYDTIIVLLADHGELLGEHGAFLHCTQPPRLAQELIHVPLVIKTPRIWLESRVRSVAEPVELVDLMPTLLDLVRVPQDPRDGIQGRSLLGTLLPEAAALPRRPVFAETQGHGASLQCVQEDGWKLVRTRTAQGGRPTAQLYRLDRDPGEAQDLSREHPAVVRKLLGRLAAWTADNERRARP